ncbi:MAG: hypothetical protein WCS72_01150 [Deltaproteobacteria bacterium]
MLVANVAVMFRTDLGDRAAWTAEGSLPVDGTLAHWEGRTSRRGDVS